MDTTTLQPSRLCCVCDKQLYGRSDKVFCDIKCKNRYHADVRKHTKAASAVSVRMLQKNYNILCLLMGDKHDRYVIKKLALKQLGFNFDNVSGVSRNNRGLKFEIFELSWYQSTHGNIVIQQDRQQSRFSPFMYRRWERHYKPLETEYNISRDYGSTHSARC